MKIGSAIKIDLQVKPEKAKEQELEAEKSS